MTTTAPSIDVADLASQLRLSVFRLARKLRREGEPEISSSLLAALSTIERHGTMTAGALAAHEQIQKPTCTRVISDLQALGLIERIPDPLDGRVAWLQVTPAARKLLQRVRMRRNVFLARRMKRLAPEDLDVLGRAVEILDGLIEADPA